jgi:hypothetical protein
MTGELLHATAVAVAVDPDGPLLGALILGASGHGKSTLALDLVEGCPFRRSGLVSDDATLVCAKEGALFAEAPRGPAGLVEIRGYGPARLRPAGPARLLAGFDLDAGAKRLPEPQLQEIAGGFLRIWPCGPAPLMGARVRVILREILAKESSPPARGA